jgi:hypothetical protein
MTEVIANDRDVDTSLQQGDRTTVPHYMWRDSVYSPCCIVLRGQTNIFVEQVSYTIACQTSTAMASENDLIAAFIANDSLQGGGMLGPE